MIRTGNERGVALVTVLMLITMLSGLLGSYFVVTRVEMFTTKSSMDSTRGFFVAEAGLNIRAEEIRQQFLGFNRPTGATPVPTPGQLPCLVGDTGSGDFQCVAYQFDGRQAVTYIVEEPGNPVSITIPPSEVVYSNLHALEYGYTVRSVAVNDDGDPEAILEMRLKSRLVPLFQFAVFYNKDLEITPGPAMTFSGPVHTNFDLYLSSATSVDIYGQVTAAGEIYNGRKENNVCEAGPIQIEDAGSVLQPLPACDPMTGRRLYAQSELDPWGGQVLSGIEPVVVPTPDALDPDPAAAYFSNADLRLMYDVDAGTVELRAGDDSLHPNNALLGSCPANTVWTSTTFKNNRELDGASVAKDIDMLEVDVQQLLQCLHDFPGLIDSKALDDSTNGGLVWYLGVTGTDVDVVNNYGVRLSNAEELQSTTGPTVQGLTVVSNQSTYVWGHYNQTNKIPAAIMSDSMNVLSGGWTDTDDTTFLLLPARDASPTTINAAFLSGTDTSGGNGGPEGVQDTSPYSGGVQNYLRLHEDWNGVTLTYNGSLVSLNQPLHVNGALVVGIPQYRPPNRAFAYDTDFNDVGKLPPMTPSFVYLKQEMFVRQFDL